MEWYFFNLASIRGVLVSHYVVHNNENFYICSGELRLLKKFIPTFLSYDTRRVQSLALFVTKKQIAKAVHINERLFIKYEL